MIWVIVAGVVLEGVVLIAALKWALPQSKPFFYSIFVGDALFRLVVLGLLSAWLVSTHRPYTVPLLTLALSYLGLSLIQIPFFHKGR